MALIDLIKEGEKFPFAPNWQNDIKKINFWRNSIKVDTDYITSKDAKGNPLLMRYPCEDNKEYKYRLAVTKPRNHVGGIINKQNGMIYRSAVERPEQDVDYQEFIKNVSLDGSTADEFFQKELHHAQVDGYAAVVIDHTSNGPEIKTLQQSRADGDRFFLRKIRRPAILNMSWNDGVLTEIFIEYVDADGNHFVRYYNDAIIIDLRVDDKGKITSVGEPIEHGYVELPVVLCQPEFESSSQVEPLAELQQGLTQTLSMLAIDEASSVFTQHALSGLLPETDESGKPQKITLGTNRIIYLGETGTLTRIGADPNASVILQEQIKKTEEAIYRTAGVASANPFSTGQVQSGISKIYELHDLSSVLSLLSKAIQKTENKVWSILFRTLKGLEPADVHYDTDFNLPDFSKELAELKDVLSVGDIPQIIKKNHIRAFVGNNYNLNEEEQIEFEAQLLAESAPPEPTLPTDIIEE